MTNIARYIDPGIYVSEITTPVLSSANIAPITLSLVGDTYRARSFSERITLEGTDPITLSKTGIDETTIVVLDAFTGTEYTLTDDYIITTTAGDDAVLSTADDVTTIQRESTGVISDPTTVLVTYEFTDTEYYRPLTLTSYDSVRENYGEPFDSTGNITSPLTLAAYFAFLNGAQTIVCVPVEVAGASPILSEWQTAIDKLLDQPTVDCAVAVTTDTTVNAYLAAHVTNASNQGLLQRCFVGLDGVTSTKASTDFISAAGGYDNERVSLVAPGIAEFNVSLGQTSVLRLSGEYISAAVAGSFASRDAQIPLTRKQIVGFARLPQAFTERTLVEMQEGNVLVVWQRRNGEVIVRHGLTTKTGTLYVRELSVQSGKDALRKLLEDFLETQNVIGSVITDDTPAIVVSAVASALELAKTETLIFDYTAPVYRIPSSNPTMVQVRFQYKPTLPLNYVNVQLGIDTQAGSIEFTDAGTFTTTA